MAQRSGTPASVWVAGAVAVVVAGALAIFVGTKIVDLMSTDDVASLPPFPTFPAETPVPPPTEASTSGTATTPPSTPTPRPPDPTATPTPTPTPEPTSPLGTVRIVGGGELEGEHQVAFEAAFLEGSSLITQIIFMVEGDQCTVLIVVPPDAKSGTFPVDAAAKISLACLTSGVTYNFFEGELLFTRESDAEGNEIVSGDFTVVGSNLLGQVTVESEFEDVRLEQR